MRIAVCLCFALPALFTSARCEAGGFFRRVPELGEWARYEITQDFIPDPGKVPESFERYSGSLLLTCVGEEVIEERRFLWVEFCYEMQITDKFEPRFVYKVLVPEEEMLQGTLTQEDIRGWIQQDKADPVELTFSADDLSEDSGGQMLLLLNAGAEASTGQMSSRSVVVNEEQMELTYIEYSPLPIREYGNHVLSGEITIWPHDDLGFGVASLEFVHRQTYLEFSSETLTETRFDLVETGTDAVSELPDHN